MKKHITMAVSTMLAFATFIGMAGTAIGVLDPSINIMGVETLPNCTFRVYYKADGGTACKDCESDQAGDYCCTGDPKVSCGTVTSGGCYADTVCPGKCGGDSEVEGYCTRSSGGTVTISVFGTGTECAPEGFDSDSENLDDYVEMKCGVMSCSEDFPPACEETIDENGEPDCTGCDDGGPITGGPGSDPGPDPDSDPSSDSPPPDDEGCQDWPGRIEPSGGAVTPDPFTDFRVGSRLPIEFKRMYWSTLTGNDELPFGPGWTHNFDFRLKETWDSWENPLNGDTYWSTNIVFQGADGKYHRYFRYSWISLSNNSIKSYYPDGSMMTVVDGTYQLETLDGIIYKFDSNNRVESIENKKGAALFLDYNQDGNVTHIKDADSLLPYDVEIVYNSTIIDRIDEINVGAKTFTYEYDGSNYLTGVWEGTTYLVQYTYMTDGATILLEKIKDPNGKTIEHHEYDDRGRANELITADEHLTFDYWDLPYAEGKLVKRIVTDEIFGYSVDVILDTNRRVVEKSGGCSSGCGNVEAQTKYIRDQSGAPTVRTTVLEDGNSTHYLSARDPFWNVVFQAPISNPLFDGTTINDGTSIVLDGFSTPYLNPLIFNYSKVTPRGDLYINESNQLHLNAGIGDGQKYYPYRRDVETFLTGIESNGMINLPQDKEWEIIVDYSGLDVDTEDIPYCWSGVFFTTTNDAESARMMVGAAANSAGNGFFHAGLSKISGGYWRNSGDIGYDSNSNWQTGSLKLKHTYSSGWNIQAWYLPNGGSWTLDGTYYDMGDDSGNFSIYSGNISFNYSQGLYRSHCAEGTTVNVNIDRVKIKVGETLVLEKYDYEILNSSPSTIYSYITDSDTLPRNTLAQSDTYLGTTLVKTVTYDYDAPGDWDSEFNETVTPNLGRIITIAKSDQDGDGNIADGTTVTYYQCFEYNANNQLELQYQQSEEPDCSDGATILYGYSLGRLASVTKHPTPSTSLVYGYTNWDDFGNPQTITDPNSIASTIAYDPLGRTTASTMDGETGRTHYEYLGQDLKKVTYPKNDYMEYTYSSVLHGLTLHKLSQAAHRNEEGDLIEKIVYGYTVSSNTRVTTEQIMDGSSAVTMEKTTVEGYGIYDGETLRYVKVTEGASGAGQSQIVTKTYYNASNQPLYRIENPDGDSLVTSYLYDDQGRLTEVMNALLDRTTYQYDAWGNLVGTTLDPDGLNIETTYVYDNFGRLIRTDSPDAMSTIYVYNADGTLAEKKEGCTSTGTGCDLVTDYEYDGLGRLVRTNYLQYDTWGEEFYVYDGELDFTPWVWNGSTVVYEDWDATLAGGTNGEGRLTAVLMRSLSDGSTQTLVATAYSYDPEGRVSGKHYQLLRHEPADENYDADSFNPFLYWYDANGALQKVKYRSGRYVYYCLDDSTDPTRPRAIRTDDDTDIDDCEDGEAVVTDIDYYPFGDIKRLELANGQVQEFTRDKRYALTNLTDGTGGDPDAYHDIDYTYDDFGDIATIADASQSVGQYADHTVLRYDSLHQLAGATLSIHDGATNPTSYHEAFTYDAAGNRASRTLGAYTETYEYENNSNALAEIRAGSTVTASFVYGDQGQLYTMAMESGGATAYAMAAYNPNGSVFLKTDWTEDGATVVLGDTVASIIMPAGERVVKANLSTMETKGYAYDLAGNLIMEGVYTETETSDPIIEHIYLGNRIIASVTGAGDACFVASVAYGTPLAEDLDVFRTFRDKVLRRMTAGEGIINWYYKHGPTGAKWLKGHDLARGAAYYTLVIVAVPLKAVMFGHWSILIIIFLCVLGVLVVGKKLGWKRSTSIITSFALAFSTIIVYSFLVEVPVAEASYSEIETFYYTVDHIGRPLNVRDDSLNLSWYEQHYPFGEIINEDTPGDDLTAGAGDNIVSWQPHFRFPGQLDDVDQAPFVQNHYREYMPELGRYNRVDPYNFIFNYQYILSNSSLNGFAMPIISRFTGDYSYVESNPIIFFDELGLVTYQCTFAYCLSACKDLKKICDLACIGHGGIFCRAFYCREALNNCTRDCVDCESRCGNQNCCGSPGKSFSHNWN